MLYDANMLEFSNETKSFESPSSSNKRRHSYDGIVASPSSLEQQLIRDSDDGLKSKLNNCIQREQDLKIKIDYEKTKKSEVVQKISFVQTELNQIQRESAAIDEHLSHFEDTLKGLKMRQVEIWNQQQQAGTINHQKSNKEWLQLESVQAKNLAEEQSWLLEQQVLQSITEELQEEKHEIEIKQEESKREAQSLNWDIQQIQKSLIHPQEQVEGLQVSMWHHMAGLQTLKEDFHDVEEVYCRAQLEMHLLEDKLADLEELLTVPNAEREFFATRRGDYQRRLDAGKQRDSQLRAQWQEQEKLIRDVLMNKIKLDREWQRHNLQNLDKERSLLLIAAEIASEEAFVQEQETLHKQKLQDAITFIAEECESTLPQQLEELERQEAILLHEISTAEENVRRIRGHAIQQDVNIQELQSQRLHCLRRQEIDLTYQLQQQRRLITCLTEREIPLAQLQIKRVSAHEELLKREEALDILPAVKKAMEEVSDLEASIVEATKKLEIEKGVLKATQKHQASLMAHTPAFLQEAEAKVKESQAQLKDAKEKLDIAQAQVLSTKEREKKFASAIQDISTQLEDAKLHLFQLQEELSQKEAETMAIEDQHRRVLQEMASLEETVSQSVQRIDCIHLIGEADALPHLLQLQQHQLPLLQQSILQLQATLHAQHLRHERLFTAWESFQQMIQDSKDRISKLREKSIVLQSDLMLFQDNEQNESLFPMLRRLRDITAELNQARVTRDRILSSIRENDQDAIHIPQHRLLYTLQSSQQEFKEVLDRDIKRTREQLETAKRSLDDAETLSSGIAIKLKRMQGEITFFWQEKLQLSKETNVKLPETSIAEPNWMSILLEKQLQLVTLQSQQRHLEKLESHLWSVRLDIVTLHYRQLLQDLQELQLRKPSILSLSQNKSASAALALTSSLSSMRQSQTSLDNTHHNILTANLLLASHREGQQQISQASIYRQQQHFQQQLQRISQEMHTILSQDIAQYEQRRFVLARDWQEKLRQWSTMQEEEQRLIQDLRIRNKDLQETKDLRVKIQRTISQRRYKQQQQHEQLQRTQRTSSPPRHANTARSPSPPSRSLISSSPSRHTHHHVHPPHPPSSSSTNSHQHRRDDDYSTHSNNNNQGTYRTPHPNPYPNYLHSSSPSTSRTSTPQRTNPNRSSGHPTSETPHRRHSHNSHQNNDGGDVHYENHHQEDNSSHWLQNRPSSAGPSGNSDSNPSEPVASASTVIANNNDNLSHVVEKDGHVTLEINNDTISYCSSSSSSSSEEEASSKNLKNDEVSRNKDEKEEEEEDEDVHTFYSQEEGLDRASEDLHSISRSSSRLPVPVSRGTSINNSKRAVSPSTTFIAGSKTTLMTPKTSPSPLKGRLSNASAEKPLRLSLNRTWSNQSLSQKMSKSAIKNSIVVHNPSNGSNLETTVKPTKKMIAMAAARQQQSQQLEEKSRKHFQQVSTSFQF